jgi:hypothetical protein
MKNINDWITENFLASERENKLNDLKEIILSDRASEVGVNGIVMPKIGEPALSNWTLVCNLLDEFLQANRHEVFVIASEHTEGSSANGAVADVQELLRAIRDLDQRERLVLTMYYNEKLTLKEIASIFDWTIDATQKQFENIINKLKIATASL